MRVLGIDPGSRLTGFGVVAFSAGRLEYVASGCIRAGTGELPARLQVIYDGVAEVVSRYRPDGIAVEKVFMARNPQSALTLGHARGAAICAGVSRQLPVAEYTALQIKRAVVGKGRAGKEQVQHMIRVLLALPGPPQADAADALACAVCHIHALQGAASMARGLGPAGRATA